MWKPVGVFGKWLFHGCVAHASHTSVHLSFQADFFPTVTDSWHEELRKKRSPRAGDPPRSSICFIPDFVSPVRTLKHFVFSVKVNKGAYQGQGHTAPVLWGEVCPSEQWCQRWRWQDLKRSAALLSARRPKDQAQATLITKAVPILCFAPMIAATLVRALVA